HRTFSRVFGSNPPSNGAGTGVAYNATSHVPFTPTALRTAARDFRYRGNNVDNSTRGDFRRRGGRPPYSSFGRHAATSAGSGPGPSECVAGDATRSPAAAFIGSETSRPNQADTGFGMSDQD